MTIDVAQTALDINNTITVLSLMRCQREGELLAGLYKSGKKPSAVELGERFNALFSRLDDEIIKTHTEGIPIPGPINKGVGM